MGKVGRSTATFTLDFWYVSSLVVLRNSADAVLAGMDGSAVLDLASPSMTSDSVGGKVIASIAAPSSSTGVAVGGGTAKAGGLG